MADGFPLPSTENAPPTGLADYNREAGAEEGPADLRAAFEAAVNAPEEASTEEHPEELQAAVEEEQEVYEEEQPQETEATSPRTQKRIQKLANEKRELTSQLESMQALVEQLREGNQLQRQTWEQQQAYLKQQMEQQAPAQRKQHMLQAGLDPTNPTDQFLYDQWNQNQQLKQQLEDMMGAMRSMQDRQTVDAFTASLSSEIDATLSGLHIPPDVKQEIVEAAQEAAAARGVDAKQAAELAANRYRRFLKPKARKKIPEDQAAAHTAISTSGRSGGKKPGPRQKTDSFEGALSNLFNG